MATSGPRYPQNAASVSRGGSTPGGSWSNPNNARTNDSSYAAVAINGKSTPVSQYLHLTNFGFDIPAGATIDGIVVEIERQVNYQSGLSSATADETVRLLDGGSPVGSNYAQPGNWATSWTVVTYGGETDTWGATWTPEKINATNFGVRIAVESTSSSAIVNNARIDFVRITVYYTQAGNVSGTVSDAETLAPLADVSVSSDDGKQTTTNASGEYTLTEVSSGTRTISFSLDGYEPTEENVSVTAGQTATLDVSLTPQRGIVAGIVRDAVTLQPIAGVSVTSDDGVSDTTAEDGSYELSPRVGSRTISLSHVAYHGAQETVTVSANASVPLDITLDPKSYQATSDASGRYGFEVIRPGTYSVTIEAPDYEPAEDVVVIETDDFQVLNIDLERLVIPVGITRGLLWEIRDSLWIARTISHHVRSSLPADRQVRYHIRSGARTPREIAYSVQVPARTAREIAYDISATARTAREIAYDIFATAGTARVVAYAVHNLRATIARSAEWIVRAQAAVQRTSQYGIRSRVASSRLAQWHQRTLLARSADVGWDVRSLLSLERVAGWRTRVAAALNRGIAYGIRSAVGRDVAATFDLRALATAARESRWNVRQWLATTRLASWYARTTAGSQRTISFSQRAITRGVRDVKWSLRSLLTRSADASWHIRATVAPAGRAVTWGVRAIVDTARVTQWAVRSRIAAARDMTWNILGSAVMTTRKIRYHVRTAFTDTRAAQWGIRLTVGDTRATQWSLRALAAATRQTAWHIRARLSAMRAPIWHVRRTVSDTRQPTWYVRTVADTARQVRYVVRALVPVTRQPNWRVRSLLTAMRDGIWRVRERLSTTRDGIWHVRSRVAATRESLWRVRGLLAATRESLWRVRGLLAATRESRWSVGALVAYATRTAVWGVRRTATQARGAAWHVRTMAVTARDAAWHALRTLAADRDTRWDIRVTVGTDRPISWLVRARLAIGRTASFGIRRTAIRAARLVWAILSRFVSAPIRASDVGEVVEAAERDGIGAAEVAALIDIEVIDMGVISRWYAGATRPIQVVVSRVDGKAMTITQATVRVRPQGSDEWSAPLPASVEGQAITANVTLPDPGIYEIRFDYQTDDGIIDIVLIRRRAHALDA